MSDLFREVARGKRRLGWWWTDLESEWNALVQKWGEQTGFWEMVEIDVTVNKG